MAYSELVKNFEKIRDYMREFYVYGFKTREEYDKRSARSYDNERRRIESWMGEVMAFRQDSEGKSVFLSVDSRSIRHNPLHKAFKARSFTDNDITLHFYLLDILAEGAELSSHALVEKIHEEYLSAFDACREIDESTIRKKMKEYEALGLLQSRKQGREQLYRLAEDRVSLESWQDAAAFFSEADPMGVVGSYVLDKLEEPRELFHFKHHYMLHALDSPILESLLEAIGEERSVEVAMVPMRRQTEALHKVCPLKILISTQTGRQYLLAYHYRQRRPVIFRLDNIHSVKPGAPEPQYEIYASYGDKFRENLWGVSAGNELSTDHLEMTIRAEKHEHFIVERLEREKRCGSIEQLDERTWHFVADVYDAAEMVTWLRTFIGRIVSLECSNPFVLQRFYGDLEQMWEIYGGESDGVQ